MTDNPMVPISRQLINDLITKLQETEPDGDPSVGIQPDYDTLGYIHALNLALAGKQFCPTCHGDGVIALNQTELKCSTCQGKGEIAA